MGAEGQERVARAVVGSERRRGRWGAGLRYNGRAGRGAGLIERPEVGHTRAGTAETARKAEG
eukprot:6719164-Prymnesium_polylepis.1